MASSMSMYRFKQTYVLVVLSICSTFTFAQSTDVASDSIRVEDLNNRANKLLESNKDSAILLLDSALKLSKQMSHLGLQAVTQYNWARVYEFYGDINHAEMRYLKWFNLRKIQGMHEYRWGMTGLREFYSRHLQYDKLKAVDDEWVQLLDAQRADGVVPPYGYQASMEAVINNLYDLGSFYDAERYFIHMVENIDTFYDYEWMQAANIYWKVETYLMYYGEAYDLEDWHRRWYKSLAAYCSDAEIQQKVIKVSYGRLLSLDPLKVMALTTTYEQAINMFYSAENKAHMMGMYFASLRDKIETKLNVGEEFTEQAKDYYETQLYVCLRIADMDGDYFITHDLGGEVKTLVKKYKGLSTANNEYLNQSLAASFGNSSDATCRKWLKYIQKKLK
jgi:tetratricopeptide (TPR) repeat protein